MARDLARAVKAGEQYGGIKAAAAKPGQKLKLEKISAAYGTSVSTLREILNRLASEGFVVAEAQRGFEVAPVSIQNLRELAQLRILLEHHALTESFRAGDMEWEGRVVSAHHKLAAMERMDQPPPVTVRADGYTQDLASQWVAELVGATRPTPLSFPDNLVLSPNGKFLYAGYSGVGAMFDLAIRRHLHDRIEVTQILVR